MKNEFGEQLQTARRYYGETQQDLALAVGAKLSSVSAWELGRHTCHLEVIPTLCRRYHVTADWLLGLTEEGGPGTAKDEQLFSSLDEAERRMLQHFAEFLISCRRKEP